MKKFQISIYLFLILAAQIAVGGNSNSDSLKNVCSDKHIALLDSSDCLYQIFIQNLNPKFVRARAARLCKNPIEIPLTTLSQIAKPDSALREEYYENPLIGIEFRKIYQIGHIRGCGFEISGGKVGKWKYFSAKGELDSIVDYEMRRASPFLDFFNIGRAFGMLGENSRLPERKRFFEIADSLGLRECSSARVFSNPGWKNLDFYPIPREEEISRFTCKLGYSNIMESRWTAVKDFNIQGKRLCFVLSFYPETKEVCIHECDTAP